VAIANSSVIGKGSDPASGNFVEIRNSRGTEFFYCHLSGYAPGIHTGQRVRQGQLLGYVGATGDATGPHLHLQVEPNGVPAPPKPWIDRWLLKALGQARALAGMTTARPPAARQDGAGGVVLPRHVMVEDVESGASTSGRSGQGAARARPSVQTVQSQASHGMPVGVPAAGFVILSMALTLAVLARRQPTHPG
jgi:murein DD-endopeptidase MepM/ murein hydrolase activator NlpD